MVQKQRYVRREDAEIEEPEHHDSETAKDIKKRTDDLLDEIENVLESPDQEALDRAAYAAMLKGWAARQPRLGRLEPYCDECEEFWAQMARGDLVPAPPGYTGPTVSIPERCL